MKKILVMVCVLLLAAAPVLAVDSEVQNSGLLVWVFLGLCALVIVAQLVPAFMVLAGMVKALFFGKGKTRVPSE